MRLPAPRSLTSRLVVTAVVLVAVVSVLVAGATAVAMRAYLTGQLDQKVVASAERAARGPVIVERGGADAEGAVVPGDPGIIERRFEAGEPGIGNQEPGTLIAFPDAGFGQILTDRLPDGEQLDDDVLAGLADVPADGEVHEVDVAGHGTYRVAAVSDGDRSLVTGLPTEDVDEALGSLVTWELMLALLGTATAAVVGTAVVRRQLRPLTEVARTAHAVAELPLESGEIGVTHRVPAHLTDPRTETGQVGSALNTLLAHVESSLDARHRSEQQVRQFVADASHELRTPLTTIAGYTELARRRDDPETTVAALAKVEEESRRMTALVEDLLLLARLDAGRPLEHVTVDLTRLLLEGVADARVLAPDHEWHLDLPADGVPVEVLGDPGRLHQVASNLLTNARRHTPPGTTVAVRVRADGFDVCDDGPGFPDDLVATAFERFTRGDSARHRAGGAGLGLALVQAIVAAHGGSVVLTSAPGDTRIRVRLPQSPSVTGG